MNDDYRHRRFQVWEYQVSHRQLLIRSPKAPSVLTNVDLIFLDVRFMQLPSGLDGIQLKNATSQEMAAIAHLIGEVSIDEVFVLESAARHFVVAGHLSVNENDWDIFESPFKFRSTYRPSSG